MRNAWRDNHGGWLLGVASVACITLAVIWKLDLVPDFEISQSPKRPLLSQTITSQNSILVAQVNASEESAGVRGMILLFPPEGDPLQPPSFQQSFQLDSSGMTTVLMVLQQGTFKVIAFLDLNENGQLDFEENKPLEPMRLPSIAAVRDAFTLPESELEVVLAPQVPVFRVFQF